MLVNKSRNQLEQLLEAEKEADTRKKDFLRKVISDENRMLKRALTPSKLVVIPCFIFSYPLYSPAPPHLSMKMFGKARRAWIV